MKVDCLFDLIKLLLSKAESNFKTYIHVAILCKFFDLELCPIEVMDLVDFNLFYNWPYEVW